MPCNVGKTEFFLLIATFYLCIIGNFAKNVQIMTDSTVVMSRDVCGELEKAVERVSPDKVFLLFDDTTERLCAPLLMHCAAVRQAPRIVIGHSDVHKNLTTLSSVWTALQRGGATRSSLLVNVGGGMVSDLGGFAASTFKRGLPYINIPTTLLSMVDASVGGKTAVNFGGLKNEIGVFAAPFRVIVDMEFLRSLDIENLLSGYAEMIKHGLISTREHWASLMNFSLSTDDVSGLHDLVERSIDVKAAIVKQDPKEKGIRKALNAGHTAGHAFEAFALASSRPVLHGYAVAWGLVAELYLSHTLKGFPSDVMQQTISYIREHYGSFAFTCKDYDTLYSLMLHDKKNTGGKINFSLLSDIGKLELNTIATESQIKAMLDFYRDIMD